MSTSKDIYPPSFLRKPWSLPDCFPLSRIDNRPENNANDDEGALDNTSFKSEVLTRHIAVYSQRYMADLNVVDLLKSSGDIRAIYPYIASGVTIASYYSLVDAKFALKCIRECHPLFKACYAKSSLIGLTGTETVFISMTSMSGSNLTGFDHMKCLNQYGSIHMLYEMNLSASSKIILIEYHDTRSLKMMQEGLDGNLIKNVYVKVYQNMSTTPLCSCFSSDIASRVKDEIGKLEVFPKSVDSAVNVLQNNTQLSTWYSPSVGRGLLDMVEDKTNQTPKEATTDYFSLFSSDPFTTLFSMSDVDIDTTKILVDTSSDNPLSTPSSSYGSNQSVQSSERSKKDSVASQISIVSFSDNKAYDDKHNMNELYLDRITKGLDKRTTLMIRNIPNKYTQQMLIDNINSTHENTYDFLYLRIDFKNKCNVGYAFINFVDVDSVVSFAKDRIGKRWSLFNSDKVCTLSYANIQGKQALIQKFRNSHVMEEDESFRPKIYYSSGDNKGKEEPFPAATEYFSYRVIKKKSSARYKSK